MRRNKFWILAIMATTLLAFAAGGCVEPLENNGPGIDPDAVKLPIRLYIPGAMPATKASTGFTGDVDGESPESQIYSVQVWMFNHQVPGNTTGDGETAVAYTEATINWTPKHNIDGSGYYPSSTNPQGHWEADDIYELPLRIPSYIIFDRAEEDLRFDFYVLANGSTIGNPASRGKGMTRAELKALTFGYSSPESDYFGLSHPVFVLTGDNPGLPIAGFFNKSKDDTGNEATGVDLKYLLPKYQEEQGFDIKAFTPVVQLKRAVSKIRFVFSRATDMTGVSITDVILDANTIPDNTWVFENTTTLIPTTSSYNAQKSLGISLATTAIGQIQDPSTLTTDYYNAHPVGEQAATAQGYDKYLTAAIKNTTPQATEKVVYLRESDKAITGTIKYRLPGMENTDKDKEAKFVMSLDSPTDYNNFLRNHYWIVYAYFLDRKLYVKPIVADWVDAAELTYTLKMNTNMRLFDSWLYRYDDEFDDEGHHKPDYDNWSNWAHSHMAVSDGRVTETTAAEPVAGRPLRSPQIELVTTGVADAQVTGSGTFQLVIDNEDFEIIRANKNDVGIVISYEASTNGKLTISAGDNVYTYFYIVPKEDENGVVITPSDPVAKVSLIYNDPFTGPQKVTYNYSSLPGYSDDSSEIWVYYFPADQYNITGKLKMYFQDYNHPLVPTPVQN